MSKPAKPADLDRESLVLSLAQRLRSLSDKAIENKNLSAAISAASREADLLLSLTPAQPTGPNGVSVVIRGDDVGLLRESAVAKLQVLAKRLDEQEKATGCCARCGQQLAKDKAAAIPALSRSDAALVEGERPARKRRDPAVPSNWYEVPSDSDLAH
jgi:hypothetical protein